MTLLVTNLISGTNDLDFHISWDYSSQRLDHSYGICTSGLACFEVAIHKIDGSFIIYLTPSPSFANRVSVKTLQGELLTPEKLFVKKMATRRVYIGIDRAIWMATIPYLRRSSGRGGYDIMMRLSNEPIKPTKAPSAPLSAPLSPGSVVDLLTSLYGDSELHDVFFVFDTTNPRTHGVEAGCVDVKPADRDPGEQRVQIKDVKPATFRVLVRFMYANEIPQNEMPTQVCADDQGSADQTSFEVFLAAHRYELQELCERAQESVVSTKDSTDAVPFLFHIGYLFDRLRAPMVKMAASSCSEVIASQTFLQEHMVHPKFNQLLHEIYKEACCTKREQDRTAEIPPINTLPVLRHNSANTQIIVLQAGVNFKMLNTPKPPLLEDIWLRFQELSVWPSETLIPMYPPNDHLTFATVPQQKMPRTGLRYEVEIRFMSQNISKTPKLPPTEIMMQKFYNNKYTITRGGVFAAVFFKLHEPIQMLHSVLVSGLNFQSAVAFMFRTACHCPDLQTDIVMYVATLCNSILREASFR
ncbi:hypothetical protein BG003_005834 [Podila horticola]|nr:hypothetical protein BG003_005834 [Podila horticola]